MKSFTLIIGLFLIATTGNQIYAQSDGAGNSIMLEEVIITAQRRTENLQDVPISVHSFSNEALERAGIQSTADLEMLTPGLVYSQGIGLGSPYMRGVGTGGNGPGTENSIAVYVDDVYVGTKSSSLSSLANVERVEVLKGPQGTLFGRNATGGLIHIVTANPPSEREMAIKLGYGNFDTKTVNMNAGLALTDKLGITLSVDYQDQDGWGRNLVSGNDANEYDNFLGRGKILYELSDATTVTVTGYYDKTDKSTGVGPRLLDGAVPASGGAAFVFPANGDKYDTNGDTESVFESESGMVALKIEHDFGFASLMSVSAYQESEYSALLDNDLTPNAFQVATVFNEEHQFSQELKLSSQSDGDLEWTLGAYAYFGDGDQVVGLSGGFLPTLQELQFNGKQETESVAIYGQGTYQFGDKTRLTAGLRYTWDEREIDGARNLVALDSSVTVVPITPDKVSFNELTWRFALDYQFTPDALGYVSYNRGFKSGLFNASFLQLTPVNPEILDAYEIGLKSEHLNQRLRLNVAGFYYDYEDIQLTQFVLGVAILRNAAKAEIYGAEMEAEYALTKELTLSGGLSVMSGTYKSFDGAGFATSNPAGGNTVAPGDASGNDIARTPDITASATLNYSMPLASGNTFSFDLSYSYNDGYFTEPDNVLRQDSYSLVNVRVQLGFLGDRVLASLWAKNLTDSFYTSVLSANAIGSLYSPSAPRTYGVSVEYHF